MTAHVRLTGSWYGLPPWVGLVAVCLGVLLLGVWLGLVWGSR